MRHSRLMFIPVLFILLTCITKTNIVDAAVDNTAGEDLFSRAENLFSTQKYNGALQIYNEYINRFPGDYLIPAALLRMGSIYDSLGENDKARNSYLRLINEHPKSIYVPKAKIKIMEGYLKQELFEDVINYSAGIFSDNLSDNNLSSKAYVLVGDAQIALKRPSDAVVSFFNAGSKNTEHDNEIINTKLKNAVSELKDDDIKFLLESTKDDNLKGYLQYQIGLRYYEKQKYKESASILNSFIQKKPDHKNVKEAKNIIQKIYGNSAGKPITIGCLLPLTGEFSVFGNKALKGVKLALSKFSNERGQVSVNLVTRDTESNPKSAVRAVGEFVKEDVCAIIGPMGTDESFAAAKEAQANRVPIVALTQKEGIAEIGSFVFRNFLMPQMQIKSIVKYAIEKKGIKRFAILYPNENYGTKFMSLFHDEVTANGGSVASVESYDPSHTDFADIIKKIIGNRNSFHDNIENLAPSGSLSANEEQSDHVDKKWNEQNKLLLDFEAVFIPDSPAKAGLIIPQLIYKDVKNVYLLGTNLWHSQKMITMAGEVMQDKAIIPDGFYGEKDSVEMKEFMNSFMTYFGEEPGFIEAIAYDTAMMLFETVSKPGIRFPETVRNELLKIKNFNGLTGRTSFDGKQDAQKEIYLLTVKGDSFVELDTD